jgi:hypothetical protein
MSAASALREISLRELTVLRGPSVWAAFPLTRLEVELGSFDELSSAELPWVTESLLAALPGLAEHGCSLGRPGGFVERLRRGTYAAHIMEHVALQLQEECGERVSFGKTRGTGVGGRYEVVFEHRRSGVGRTAGLLACGLVRSAFAGLPLEIEEGLGALRSTCARALPDAPPGEVECAVWGRGAEAWSAHLREALELPGQGVAALDTEAPLRTGLPFRWTRAAVLLPPDVARLPPRWSGEEGARELALAVAATVPRGGPVAYPAGDAWLGEALRRSGRRPLGVDPHLPGESAALLRDHLAAGAVVGGGAGQ